MGYGLLRCLKSNFPLSSSLQVVIIPIEFSLTIYIASHITYYKTDYCSNILTYKSDFDIFTKLDPYYIIGKTFVIDIICN